MKRHESKVTFSVMAVTVIVLEVLSFLVFIAGLSLAVYNMFALPPIFTSLGVIVVAIGATTAAFLLLAIAEFLQLLLKIEFNTRKKK